MAIQIIEENRRPTTTEQFNSAFGRLAQGAGQFGMAQGLKKKQQEAMQAENEAANRLGLDLSGIQDPKVRQQAFASKFQGQKPLTALQESQKSLADERLKALQGEQGYFDEIIGNKGSQSPQQIEQPQQEFQDLNQSEEQPNQPRQGGLQGMNEKQLSQLAAFKGQPGKKGVMGNAAQAEIDQRHKSKIESPEYQRDIALSKAQASADSKFYQDLNERKGKQILKKESLNRLEDLGKKKVTGKIWESVADRMGLTQLTSEGYREYTAEQKNQFTDFKAIAGSQLSAREFFTLASAYPNSNFTPEANAAIISNLKAVHDTLDEEENIAKRLIKENKGKIPEFFQEKVNTALSEYVSKKADEIKKNTTEIMRSQYGIPDGFTLMFDPETGDPLSVPDDHVVNLIEEGLADLP